MGLRKGLLPLLSVVFLLALVIIPVHIGSTPSNIHGRVTWENGLPVEGATVVIRNLNSSDMSLQTKTDGDGYYAFKPGLFSNDPGRFADSGDVLNITVTYTGENGKAVGYREFVLGNESAGTAIYEKEIDFSLPPISSPVDSDNGNLPPIGGILVIVLVLVAVILLLWRKKRNGDR